MNKIKRLLAASFRTLTKVFSTKESVGHEVVQPPKEPRVPTKESEHSYYRFRAGLRMLGCFVLAILAAGAIAVTLACMGKAECLRGSCALTSRQVAYMLVPTIACIAAIVGFVEQTVSFIKLCIKSKAEFARLDAIELKRAKKALARERKEGLREEVSRKKAEKNAETWSALWELIKGLAGLACILVVVYLIIGSIVSFSDWFIGAFGIIAFLLLLILLFK